MSNYTAYNNQLENKIANVSEVFYDEDMKRTEMNNTTKEILRMYDVREFRRKTMITFDSAGIASKPSNYFRMKELWDVLKKGAITAFSDAGGGLVTVTSAAHTLIAGNVVMIAGTTSYDGTYYISNVTTNTFDITATWVADDATGTFGTGVRTNIYNFIEVDETDYFAPTQAHFWTEDDVDGDGTFKLKCWPINSGILNIRYIARPVDMATDSTDNGLAADWDEAVIYGTVSRVYANAGRPEWQEYQLKYEDACAKAWAATKNIGGIKAGTRVKSRYDRQSLLGGFTVGGKDYDRSSPITG